MFMGIYLLSGPTAFVSLLKRSITQNRPRTIGLRMMLPRYGNIILPSSVSGQVYEKVPHSHQIPPGLILDKNS